MKKKILVVDDDDVQRDLYHEVFKAKGYDVILAKDGLEGLEVATKEKPDLVFTGIMMPKLNGFELINKLRLNQETNKIPVMIFSHLGRDEDREKAKKITGVSFLVKGLDGPKDILQKVDELIDGANK